MNHICTTDSLVAGGTKAVAWCPICCTDNHIQIFGFVGSKCTYCGHFCGDDQNMTVRSRRQHLKLSRLEIADICRVKRSTIAKYENWWPSRKYWEATRKLVEDALTATTGERE